jgi:hypothetical protein
LVEEALKGYEYFKLKNIVASSIFVYLTKLKKKIIHGIKDNIVKNAHSAAYSLILSSLSLFIMFLIFI